MYITKATNLEKIKHLIISNEESKTFWLFKYVVFVVCSPSFEIIIYFDFYTYINFTICLTITKEAPTETSC
jgi:hypothetical protein